MSYHVTVIVKPEDACPATRKITLYVLKCADGSFYVGITKDLKKRLIVHKRKMDFELFHKEFYPDYKSARIREKYYKKRDRIRLIKEIQEINEVAG
jgi:predicted GIY-YIG superfamily endonuclease